jgi:hypothetical protein
VVRSGEKSENYDMHKRRELRSDDSFRKEHRLGGLYVDFVGSADEDRTAQPYLTPLDVVVFPYYYILTCAIKETVGQNVTTSGSSLLVPTLR